MAYTHTRTQINYDSKFEIKMTYGYMDVQSMEYPVGKVRNHSYSYTILTNSYYWPYLDVTSQSQDKHYFSSNRYFTLHIYSGTIS